VSLPNTHTDPWEEQIDDENSILWTCRDPKIRRVLRVINHRPLLVKQKAAGIPKQYRAARLHNWDESKSNPHTSAVVRTYVHQSNHSLFLSGPVGTGKTWAECCIGNELLKKGKGVKFVRVSDLLLQILDSFSRESRSELQVLQPFFEVQFLLLDELGDVCLNHDRTASDFVASRLLLLLDKRFQHGRVTLLTSNLDLQRFTEWVGDERVSSRIRGMCGAEGIIELQGRDLRFDAVPEGVGAD
jgi:DNA replication protein DnaC